jgi:hypothetical protein
MGFSSLGKYHAPHPFSDLFRPVLVACACGPPVEVLGQRQRPPARRVEPLEQLHVPVQVPRVGVAAEGSAGGAELHDVQEAAQRGRHAGGLCRVALAVEEGGEHALEVQRV